MHALASAALALPLLFITQRLLANRTQRAARRDRALWAVPHKCTAVRRPLAEQLARIIGASAELRQPEYRPTWWAAHPWANCRMLWFVAKDHLSRLPGMGIGLRREGVDTPDGGTIQSGRFKQ